jgi:hypothetical protein
MRPYSRILGLAPAPAGGVFCHVVAVLHRQCPEMGEVRNGITANKMIAGMTTVPLTAAQAKRTGKQPVTSRSRYWTVSGAWHT